MKYPQAFLLLSLITLSKNGLINGLTKQIKDIEVSVKENDFKSLFQTMNDYLDHKNKLSDNLNKLNIILLKEKKRKRNLMAKNELIREKFFGFLFGTFLKSEIKSNQMSKKKNYLLDSIQVYVCGKFAANH